MSARFPYPAVRPGDGPFMQPQSSGTVAALAQSISFFAIIVLALPAAGIRAGSVSSSAVEWHVRGSCRRASAIGCVAFFGGLHWGGRIFDTGTLAHPNCCAVHAFGTNIDI